MAKREVSRGAAIGMLAVLFLVCIATCLTPGVMVSHDTQFHVLRIEGLANAIERGEWVPMLFPGAKYNYGYATPLFYGSSFLYIPALLTVAGVANIRSLHGCIPPES